MSEVSRYKRHPKWTDAQQAARERNWYVFKLRGLWHQAMMIETLERRQAVQALIDQELAAMDLEPEIIRQLRRLRELSIGSL